MELTNKTFVVTGAASGIGRATGLALLAEGSRVALTDINAAGLEEVAAAFDGDAGQVLTVACDLTSDTDVARVRAEALNRFGRVDVVCNIAARCLAGPPDAVPPAEWSWEFDTNVLGALRMTQAFLPEMIERGDGHVVFTSSSIALFPGHPVTWALIPYLVSKSANLALGQGMALYLRAKGLDVSVFAPDITDTSSFANARFVNIEPQDMVSSEEIFTEAQTPEYAAEILLEGLRKEQFLICSVPDYAEALLEAARHEHDPAGLNVWAPKADGRRLIAGSQSRMR